MKESNPRKIQDAVADRYGALAREHLRGNASGTGSACCAPAAGEPGVAEAPTENTGNTTAGACCGGPLTETAEATGCGCGPVHSLTETGWVVPDGIYPGEELAEVDPSVAAMSLGSGDPIALADIQPGETVLDLGSGAGLDCLLASRRTGPRGKVIGVDMTPEMIELARRNIERAGARNIEVRHGRLEEMPVESETVDVVISNCVLNLSPEKSTVLAEAYRVLRPGGRFRVTDIVWTKAPDPGERRGAGSWPGCVSGALTVGEFEALLHSAGFVEARVEVPSNGHEGPWVNAEVSARKPR